MSRPPIPPTGSTLRVEPRPGGWVIVWPRLSRVWLVVNLSLGALLIGYGATLLVGSTGPPLLRFGVGILLAFAGLAVGRQTVVATFAPEHLEVADGELRRYQRWGDRTVRSQSLRLDQVVEIHLRESTARGHRPGASKEERGYELVVRTADELWILGRDLDDRDLRWLARTVAAVPRE